MLSAQAPGITTNLFQGATTMTTALRDRLWLWCHNAGVYNRIKSLGDTSDFTPVEAATYLGIHNLLMVVYGGQPTPPFAPIQKKFTPFDRVVWSLIGDAGSKHQDPTADLQEVLALHRQFPNVVGGIMDDFFQRGDTFDLADISRRMRAEKLPLWVVVYTHELDRPDLQEKLELCDVIAFWTWHAKHLPQLPENMARLKAMAPRHKIALGCYLWDFGDGNTLSVDQMRFQCDLGLQYLRDKTINDMIILGSPLVGMNLPTMDWTRDWIRQNHDCILPG